MSNRGVVTKRLRDSYMKRGGRVPAANVSRSVEIQPKKEEPQSLPVGAVPQKIKREVKPKKEYDLPGQKKDTPAENDALRKFYTSLRLQRKDSELAMKWCVEHGLETRDVAEKWVQQHSTKKTSASTSMGARSIRGNGQINGAQKTVQKRTAKRKMRSADDALPPKEISRAPKTAKISKPGPPKNNPGAESKPEIQRQGIDRPKTKPRTPRVQPKREEPTLPAGIEGDAWESSSDEELSRSKPRVAV